jgi:hypothetical protein
MLDRLALFIGNRISRRRRVLCEKRRDTDLLPYRHRLSLPRSRCLSIIGVLPNQSIVTLIIAGTLLIAVWDRSNDGSCLTREME